MIHYAAVGANGLAAYTVQPSDANQVVEGSASGPNTLRRCPEGVEVLTVLQLMYWDKGWHDLPPRPNPIYDWDAALKQWYDPRTLSDIKLAKNLEINESRAKANRTSFTFNGKQIAADALSRSDIDATNGYIGLYGAMPTGWPGGWKAMDNTYVAITTVDQWKAFYTAMFNQGSLNFAKAQQLKQELADATTPEQVDIISWK